MDGFLNFGGRDTKVVLYFSKLSKGAESFSKKEELLVFEVKIKTEVQV